jgi:hypothetical protein
LAAINFEERARNNWVEDKVRDVFYKALDTNLRLEVDHIEAVSHKMSSATMLDTYISRANLKSNNEIDLDTSSDRDTVRAIHRREEPRHRLQRVQRSEPNEKRGQRAEIMRKLNITPETLVTHGRFCWACGAGHEQLNEEEYHSREYCSMPWYNENPHECREGIYLMHKDGDCPYSDEENNGTTNSNEVASDEEDEPKVNEECGEQTRSVEDFSNSDEENASEHLGDE